MYDVGEYEVKLDIPSDNYVFYHLYPHHLEHIKNFLDQIQPHNEKTLIILFGGFQCLQERDFWIAPIDEYSKTRSNPLVVFSGKLTPDHEYSIPKINFLYKRISMFELVSNFYYNRQLEIRFKNVDNDCYKSRSKKFYWASTKDWYTRRYVLAGLLNQNLIQDGLVNYKCLFTDIPGPWVQHHIKPTWAAHIDNECNLISNKIPLPPLDDTVEFAQTDINFYLDSYIGIITDTFFDNGIFLSEKIFNAINYQQLFFYVGYQGTLQYLRKQGYCVFDDIIDTSYDTIEEPGARLVAARQSLIDFLKQPLDTIKLAYEKNIAGIQHNKQLLQQQRPDLQFTECIRGILSEN